jgi:sulfur-carrier protein
MPVVVLLSTPLRAFTSGRDSVTLPGSPATVGEALETLFRTHPALRDRVVTEQGQIRLHVNIFVDGESIRHTGFLKTPLSESCEIALLPAVSGGALHRHLGYN